MFLPIRAALCVIAGALAPRKKRSIMNIRMFSEKANVTPATSMVIMPHIIIFLRPNLYKSIKAVIEHIFPY